MIELVFYRLSMFNCYIYIIYIYIFFFSLLGDFLKSSFKAVTLNNNDKLV